MTDYNARQFNVEPPQAAEMIVNLIRLRKAFAMEAEDYRRGAYGHSLHDTICIAVGAALDKRNATHLYAEDIVFPDRDNATWFALDCLDKRICFSVTHAIFRPQDAEEWRFVCEREKRRGLEGVTHPASATVVPSGA